MGSLDHRGNDFKQKDRKSLTTKGLITEIIGKRKEQLKGMKNILEYEDSPSMLELTPISYFVLDNHYKNLKLSTPPISMEICTGRVEEAPEETGTGGEQNLSEEEENEKETEGKTTSDEGGTTREESSSYRSDEDVNI